MKISSLLLTLSLAANGALVAIFVAGRSNQSAQPAIAVAAPASTPVEKKTEADTDVWSVVQNEDLRVQVEKLRAEGFPPNIIRAIIRAQVMESFAARRKALEKGRDTAYWLPPSRDPKIQTASRALYREQEKVLKDLLGPDPDNNTAAQLRRQAPELPADKLEQIAQIKDRYDEMRSDLYASLGSGTMLPDEREKVNALAKTMHDEFASVLTPQELESYDLRTSSTANQLRYQLVAFDATEQEFRDLYKLQSAFDDQYRYTGPASQDQMRARNDARNVLDQNIKLALGDQRYSDYQRATDDSYRTTTQLVARLDLPPETANQVYALQKDLQQRAQDVRRNTALSAPDRASELATLTSEAQAKLTAALTPRGYEAYKQYGGQWLQQLDPAVRRGPIVTPGR